MKRIALLTVLLLVVGLTAGFAIDVKPTVTLSGTATLTWAYNVDTGATGFKNAADGAFRLSLLAEDGTDTHAGTGDAFGSISFANLEFFYVIDSAALALTAGPADADITAKLVVTPFEIGITTAPGFTQDFFGALEDADVPDRVVDKTEVTYAMPGSGFTTPYGTWLTATFGPAAVTLKVVSDGDWVGTAATAAGATTYEQYTADGTELTVAAGDYVDAATGTDVPAATTLTANKLYLKKVAGAAAVAATDNTDNKYAFGAEAVLTFAPITLSAGAYMGDTATSFYAKAAVDAAPIVVWAGFEGALPTTGDMTYGGGLGLTFTLVKDTTLAATAWYGEGYHGLDLQVVFTEPGDAGLVPMLDAALTFNLLDVSDPSTPALSSEYEAILALGYKVGLNSDMSNYARPFVTFTYGSNVNDGAADLATAESVMYATAGVQLQVIPLTLFTAQWVSGSTTGNDLASTTMSLGTVQFIATVTY